MYNKMWISSKDRSCLTNFIYFLVTMEKWVYGMFFPESIPTPDINHVMRHNEKRCRQEIHRNHPLRTGGWCAGGQALSTYVISSQSASFTQCYFPQFYWQRKLRLRGKNAPKTTNSKTNIILVGLCSSLQTSASPWGPALEGCSGDDDNAYSGGLEGPLRKRCFLPFFLLLWFFLALLPKLLNHEAQSQVGLTSSMKRVLRNQSHTLWSRFVSHTGPQPGEHVSTRLAFSFHVSSVRWREGLPLGSHTSPRLCFLLLYQSQINMYSQELLKRRFLTASHCFTRKPQVSIKTNLRHVAQSALNVYRRRGLF